MYTDITTRKLKNEYFVKKKKCTHMERMQTRTSAMEAGLGRLQASYMELKKRLPRHYLHPTAENLLERDIQAQTHQ